MWWGRSGRTGIILVLLAIGLTSGCSAARPHDIDGLSQGNLLFSGDDGADLLATRIGRSDWPATFGRTEGAERTVFIEFYRDFQGHNFLERNNPRRVFRSYRVGSQSR